MVAEMVPWKAEVEALGNKVVGSTLVELDRQIHDCYNSECSLGNFVTDTMVDYVSLGHNNYTTITDYIVLQVVQVEIFSAVSFVYVDFFPFRHKDMPCKAGSSIFCIETKLTTLQKVQAYYRDEQRINVRLKY